jgi:hypothetical protein
LVGKATTDTLTNKTLTGAAMNGTLGATTPSTGAFTTVQIGTNPAGVSIGVLGIPNQKRIYGRNAANSADVNVLYVDGSNGLVLGPSDAAVINASGNLGIGTTSPDHRLEVSGSSESTTTLGVGVSVENTSFTTNTRAGIVFRNGDNYGASVWSPRTGSSAGALVFGTNGGAGTAETNIAERARIDSSGNLLVGTTSASSAHLVKVTNTTNAGLIFTGPNSVANDGTLSATIANGSILMVSENNTGDGALFFCGYKSATITLVADPNGRYATSVTAGRICVTKSANSGTVTITNKTGVTASITFSKVSNSD